VGLLALWRLGSPQGQGGDDGDAPLSSLYRAPQLPPGLEARHAGGVGALAGDQKLVAEAVAREPRHDGQVVPQGLAVAGLQGLGESVQVFFGESFGLFGFHGVVLQ